MLVPDVTALEEIVVIGYGTQQKKEVTSAIVSVQEDDFNKGNVNRAAELLQGKVAGLDIARPGGNPNQPYTVRLRGLNTIGANSEPLIVIDGVVQPNKTNNNNLNPNDIESISVLKNEKCELKNAKCSEPMPSILHFSFLILTFAFIHSTLHAPCSILLTPTSSVPGELHRAPRSSQSPPARSLNYRVGNSTSVFWLRSA
jgi:hypothetical protein